MSKLWAALVVLTVSLSAGAAFAQAGEERVVYKKKTVIDFTDVIIEGELTKPEGSYIVNRKLSKFSSLIKLRENFVPELLASPNQL
ncbi:MAG: hypothetical protein HYZ27_02445 [Deltaproteobacteria bacterium]|nr:hypothetical protein [Deltaproteobacteria bacterium]